MSLPRLYVIADAETLLRHNMPLRDFAQQLARAGVTLVQLRDKRATPATLARDAAILRAALPGATLILNDQPHPAYDGSHRGQTDPQPPVAYYGVSTHTPAQVIAADQTTADYLAIGPVFVTQTKPDAEPPVGLEGLRQVRALTNKPLVAIGGITRQNCRQVLEAGANSIAVISALFSPGETVEEVARDFLRILR